MFRNLVLTLLLAFALTAQPKAIADAKAKAKTGDYETAITTLDTALKTANAKDAVALKAALAETHYAAGDAAMTNEKLPPFRKYPAALRSFRKVLEYDKNHAKAKTNIATIEGIYKQMGRPIPQ
jgi:tetratricopeptide (TPR) repeat protein